MLTASPAVVGDQITIQPQYEGMAPGEIICFVPVDRGFGEEMETLFPDEDGVIRLPRNRHTGQPFRYMLGWTIEGMRWPFFEKWAEKTFHQ